MFILFCYCLGFYWIFVVVDVVFRYKREKEECRSLL